ncbi:hypothetical protein PhCBS80983_g05778 [Powellomyces hirtus]|uniref:Uncharacterized protein n=1 Tax=Powellomyces hirtus TaxID=109895 RepID=A0A507DTF2_9FUNG|nr:hypothetical protein PhCBS80983_g05778 [Powellomyces hirtus]
MAKKVQKKASTTSSRPPVSNVPITSDPRFARVHSDPRFIKARKDASKVTIDSRFAGMLESDEFGTGTAGPKVDKYGRAAKGMTKGGLERFYKLDEESEGSEGSEGSEEVVGDGQEESGDDEDAEVGSGSDEDEEDEDLGGRMTGYDLARGGGLLESDSESEAADDDDNDDNDDATAGVSTAPQSRDTIDIGPYAEESVPTGEETARLAVVNLDWDHVKARDLYKIFDGFKPTHGAVKSVSIYPSEFGKERLEREAREGPPKELFENSDDESDNNVDSDGEALSKPLIQADDGTEAYDNVKLRKYQLERLRYYYAVVECDSTETARAIYTACDGTEYEASANFFDLRYIPTDMTFTDPPHDVATDLPAAYTPKEFVTNALQHSKVKLTWDEDDDERVRVTRRKFTKADLQDMDFKAYLASSSSEDEDGTRDTADAIRNKFKSILGGDAAGGSDSSDDRDDNGHRGGAQRDKDEELEITFAPGLSEKAAKLLEKRKEGDAQKDETVFDAYLRKRKEKRKAKKAATKKPDASDVDDQDGQDDDEDQPLGGGGGSSDGDEHAVDMSDPFFAEEFADADQFEQPKPSKKSKSNSKSKSKSNSKPTQDPTTPPTLSRGELELLIAPSTGSAQQSEGRHFDAKQVIKEEKAAKNKNKNRSKKNKSKEQREGGIQDGFEINTADPRFEALLENHQFAIDPTNPQ